MSTKPTGSDLDLNPGPLPRRGKPILSCKCLLMTFVVLTCTAVGLLLLALTIFAAWKSIDFGRNFFSPHQKMYHNASIEELSPSQRASVVQPLLTSTQEFDIAVTVWLRTQDLHRDDRPTTPPVLEVGDPVETPLYSDIVFRRMRLTDKNVFADVNFTLPTAIL